MPATGGNEDRFGWRREGRNMLRAVAAGALIGMPLLYTMEMWSRGVSLPPGRLLGGDAVTRGPEAWVVATVILWLPAVIGGAAGRLIA
jgi:hypothetical protein